MEQTIVKRPTPKSCEPITCSRDLSDCWVAGSSLRGLQTACMSRMVETALSVYIRSDAWVPCSSLSELAAEGVATAYVDSGGEPLAWTGGSPEGPRDNCRTLAAPDACFLIKYPWDLLAVNGYVVGRKTENVVNGIVSERAQIDGVLEIGAGSRILPGVYIEGNVIVGRDCKIGPNCYLRGNTSIGDGCHIGQSVEIKNSILMPGVSIGHLSYCGDSIIGTNTNLGAGTITANFRHDGANHRSMIGGELVDTGLRKLGAIIGDDVHTGIHTSIYPGRKIWPGLSTRPGDIVQRDLKP